MGKSLTELMSASISNAIVAQRAWDGIIILANNYGAEPGKDSTAAIQKAINDAKEKGKSEVYFQPGAYSYTSLSGTDGIVFVGDGVTVTGVTPTIPVVSTAQLADIALNVKAFGAKGDGSTDDYSPLKALVDSISGKRTIYFPAGDYYIGSNITIPANVTLWFAYGAKIVVGSGVTLTIKGGIIAGIYQIFDGDGIIDGTPQIERVYTEWFGTVQSPQANYIDTTAAFNRALQTAYRWGGVPIQLIAGMGDGSNFGYWVTTLIVPKLTNLIGVSIDLSYIFQIPGTTTPCLTDDPNTGAFSIRLRDLSIRGNWNSSDGIVLGFNPPPSGQPGSAFVWGVQGRIERVNVQQFRGNGIKYKGSVPSLIDVTVALCGVGIHMEGGSTSGQSIVGDTCQTFMELMGGGHKLFGLHYESNKGSSVPPDFDLSDKKVLVFESCIESKVYDLTVVDGTYTNVVWMKSSTKANAVEKIAFTGTTYTFTHTIKDDASWLEMTQRVTSYQQAVVHGVLDVTDDMRTFSRFWDMAEQSGGIVFKYVGSDSQTVFRVPRKQYDGRKITVINASDVPITIAPNSMEAGETIFLGTQSTLALPAKGSITLICDGETYWILSFYDGSV